MPAFLAAVASSTFRVWSMAYWASKLPAAARVVPRAESRMEGVGERDERVGAQVVVSLLMCERSVGDEVGSARRVRAWRVGGCGRLRSAVRMWEP